VYGVAWWRPGIPDCNLGSSCFSAAHNTAYIAQDDISYYIDGVPNNSWYMRCEKKGRWWNIGPEYTHAGFDLGALIAHELLGHGASGSASHDFNGPVMRAENRYHIAMGQPTRCSR